MALHFLTGRLSSGLDTGRDTMPNNKKRTSAVEVSVGFFILSLLGFIICDTIGSKGGGEFFMACIIIFLALAMALRVISVAIFGGKNL